MQVPAWIKISASVPVPDGALLLPTPSSSDLSHSLKICPLLPSPAGTTVEHSRVSSQRGEDNKESPKSQRCSLHFLTPHMCCCRIREGEKSSLQQNSISFLGSSMYETLASFYQQLAHNLHGISRSASRTIYSTELEQLTRFVMAAGEVYSIAAFKKKKSLDDF